MTRHHVSLIALLVVVLGAGMFFAKTTSEKATLSPNSQSPGVSPSPTTSVPVPTMTKLPSGLQLQDVVVGTGVEATRGDLIAAHYVGTLTNGTKFDSSYDRGQPFQFVLGAGQVIEGWDTGIVGMRVGGKRKLIIPAALAYGEREVGGVIPANSTLLFEVELVAVQKQDTK